MAEICVALATYNGEKYLKEMLDSLCAQTRPADEVWVLDDASRDSTVSILREYEKKLPMKIFENASNQGHCKTFSRLLELMAEAHSEPFLVALADQDDVWFSKKLEWSEKKIGDSALVFGDAEVIDSAGKILGDFRALAKISTVLSVEAQIAGTNNVTGCLSLFRSELLSFALPIPKNITVHDRWLSLLALRHGGVSSVDEKWAQYRIHENNAVGFKRDLSMKETLETAISYATALLSKKELLKFSPKEISFAEKFIGFNRARLKYSLPLFYWPWVFKNRAHLFPFAHGADLFKKISFSAIGLPLAKIIFGKR